MTAVLPEIDECTSGRPVSAARICDMATCCWELADRRYERLLVVTTRTSAPSRTLARAISENADSKQIIVATGTPRTLNSARLVPGAVSRPIWSVAPIQPSTERSGRYSPNGTRCCFE